MIAVQAVAVYEPIVTSNYDAGNSRLAPTVTVVMVCLYAPVFTRLPLCGQAITSCVPSSTSEVPVMPRLMFAMIVAPLR